MKEKTMKRARTTAKQEKSEVKEVYEKAKPSVDERRELDYEVVFEVMKEVKLRDGDRTQYQGIKNYAKAVCAHFKPAKSSPHLCKCYEISGNHARTVKKLEDGLAQCPRCGGVVFTKTAKSSAEKEGDKSVYMTKEENDKKNLIITLWLERDFLKLQDIIGKSASNAIAFITGFYSKEIRDKDFYCLKCKWPMYLCTCKSVGDTPKPLESSEGLRSENNEKS